MDDYTLLKTLQNELIETLNQRIALDNQCNEYAVYSVREVSVAKIRRLRLQIQEVMLRIERKCGRYCTDHEAWHD